MNFLPSHSDQAHAMSAVRRGDCGGGSKLSGGETFRQIYPGKGMPLVTARSPIYRHH